MARRMQLASGIRASAVRIRPVAWPLLPAAAFAAVWLVRWVRALAFGPQGDDFRDFYVATRLGLEQGWARVYELSAQHAAAERMHLAQGWMPFFNPPPAAWLLSPFTLLPYRGAYAAWTVLLLAALVAVWAVLAPRSDPWTRAAHGAAALALFPVGFNLVLGQFTPIVALGIALSAACMQRNRPWLAGFALVLIDVKPQIAFLVPVAVLASGAWRPFVGWAVPTAALALISVLALGQTGSMAYADALLHASALDQPSLRLDALLPLGGPARYVLPAAAAVTALAIARRLRHDRRAVYAAGLVGSLLATPHLNAQDLTILVVAAWILWPARRAVTGPAWVTAGWLSVQASIGFGIPAVMFEAAVLGRLAVDAWRDA